MITYNKPSLEFYSVIASCMLGYNPKDDIAMRTRWPKLKAEWDIRKKRFNLLDSRGSTVYYTNTLDEVVLWSDASHTLITEVTKI